MVTQKPTWVLLLSSSLRSGTAVVVLLFAVVVVCFLAKVFVDRSKYYRL